tara:strand:+ start:114 stop:557 length:444 start_codon:yes stop_codon:yes gene_type:complete
MEHYNNPRFAYSTFNGNWEIDNHKLKVLDLKYVYENLLTDDKLKIVKHKEIAWRGKHHFPYNLGDNCYCCGGEKFKKCDPSVPGIIAYNCQNPYDNKYRMLDGRHRIMRLLFEGKTESKFYVFDFNEIKQFIRDDRSLTMASLTLYP